MSQKCYTYSLHEQDVPELYWQDLYSDYVDKELGVGPDHETKGDCNDRGGLIEENEDIYEETDYDYEEDTDEEGIMPCLNFSEDKDFESSDESCDNEDTDDPEDDSCSEDEVSVLDFSDDTIVRYPIAMAEMCVVVKEDVLYSVGGRNGIGRSRSNCYKYIFSSKLWLKLANLGVPRHCFSACIVDDYILAVGGYDGGGKITSSLEVYSILQNKWKSMQKYPDKVVGTASCEWRGRCYTSGGLTSVDRLKSQIHCYDLQTNSWSLAGRMEEARAYHCMAVVEDRLYILGGSNNTSVELFNETTGQSQVIAELPHNTVQAACAVQGSNILMAGGEVDTNVLLEFNTITLATKVRNLEMEEPYRYDAHSAVFF